MPSDPHTTTAVPGDLADPAFYQNGAPERLWADLRSSSPVHRINRAGGYFWAVMTHAVIGQVLRDSVTFTSERGMNLDHNPEATAAAAGKMLIVTDPPRHAKIKGVMNSAFTPRMVARLEGNMRLTAAAAVDQALEEGSCDFTQVAAKLPVAVICDMLGVPEKDWQFMLERTMLAFGATPRPDDRFAAAVAHVEIMAYYEDLIAQRRREPKEDIITALVHAMIDGSPLTDEEIFLNCDGLISGGNETTRHATAGGLLALFNHPDQWARLCEDPALLSSAVPEILRHTSPAMHVLRTATRDTTLAGQAIRGGDMVALWLPSGNRDETVFAHAEDFDIERSRNPHLTFAAGTHFCLGASLATTELTVMFDEINRRVGHVERAGPVRRMRSNLIWGFESLPVTLTPA